MLEFKEFYVAKFIANQCYDSSMSDINHNQVRFITITAANAGQRIDNFLIKEYKFLPRTAIYKLLRKGEIRVNKKRTKPVKKLEVGDEVRIAPIRDVPVTNEPEQVSQRLLTLLEKSIILEDNHIIVINKPAGIAVHGGTDNKHGVIEILRQLKPELEFLELAHRIDKETSGLLLLAKNRVSLLDLHDSFKTGNLNKQYQTLVLGKWVGGERRVENYLERSKGGMQNMRVNEVEEGKRAESIFTPMKSFSENSLLAVRLMTGRMHQIRTQLADLNLPIAGDGKYGDFAGNRAFSRKTGLKRLFLHAYRVDFKLAHNNKVYKLEAPLADDLQAVLDKL